MAENGADAKVAIVTGAAGGFGQELVKAFVAEGYRVGASDVQPGPLAELERRYGRDRVLGTVCDISDPAACASHVEAVMAHFGGLHVLVNNGAMGMHAISNEYFRRTIQIEEVTVETWQRMIATNLSGAFFLSKAAVPILRAQGWGRIINVTTSFMTMIKPGFSPYGPAKAGLEALSAALAGELAGTGITVNVVVPGGPADTAMVPKESGFLRERLIPPAAMALPMLWLCSDAAGEVTGRRFVAAEWDQSASPEQRARTGRDAAWPELGPAIWPE